MPNNREEEGKFRSGFVSLIGRPNVGKSTLMNHVIGQKIAIMSDKPQTTRNKIHGVYTTAGSQIVFLDTPGIHKPQHQLGRNMVASALNTLREVDLILFLVDVKQGFGGGDAYIMEHLHSVKTPVFLILNKIDLVHPEELLPLIDLYRQKNDFAEIVPVSAKLGNNVDRLLTQMENYLPQGPQYYPTDQVTDHPERFIVAELIREQILDLTREEVPHSIAVEIEQIEADEVDGVIDVSAVIYTERPSQKKILIGRQGSMLKKVGSRARKEIEALLGSKVYLQLWVKVKKDWRNQVRQLRSLGYDERDT